MGVGSLNRWDFNQEYANFKLYSSFEIKCRYILEMKLILSVNVSQKLNKLRC